MAIKTSLPLSYTSYYVEKRKTKRLFLKQISQLIHWESVTHLLEQYYPTGKLGQGRRAYPALVRFKMTLLQTWYKLSRHGLLVKQGAILDASVTPTLRKPKGKTRYTLEPEGQ